MGRRIILTAVFFCTTVSRIGFIHAQSRLDSLQHLDEVLVTANAIHNTRKSSPYSSCMANNCID